MPEWRSYKALVLAACLTGVSPVHANDEALLARHPFPLRNNPFSPPPHSLLAEQTRIAIGVNNDLELSGIMLAGSASKAEINGRVLGIGEAIDGYRVVAVERRRVELERNGERKFVSLDQWKDVDVD